MFHKGEIPFVRLLIPLILGISFGWFLPEPIVLQWGIISLVFILVAFTLLLVFYKRAPLYRYPWILGVTVHAFLLLLGYFLCLKVDERGDPKYFTADADALVLQITNEPKSNGLNIRFQADVVQRLKNKTFYQTKGKLMVTLKMDSIRPLHLMYGDLLLAPAKFNEVDPPFNPAEFDFKNHLANRQIYHQAFINQQQVIVLKRNVEISIISFALKLRKKLVDKFYTYLPNKEVASLASALILGYRTDLSKEVLHTYSQTGTMHVLAVSGMHVGIVFLVLIFLLKPLSRNPNTKLLGAILMILSIWFYALITGFSPSVCRASTMLSFVVLGKAFGKSQNTYNLLAISAFFLLLYHPLYLFDVSFQLSYLAVIGLVYLHPKIYQMLFLKNKLLDCIWSYSALSIAAQLTTFPISIYYFHQFPLYFLLSNLLIVLPVTLLMYLGIAFLLVPFAILLKPLGLILNGIILFTNIGLQYIQELPFASLGGMWMGSWQCVLMYTMISCFTWLCMEANKKAFFVFMGLMIVWSFSITYQVIQNQNRHELIFYSLRRNTAIAHIFQGKGTLVTDISSTNKTVDFSIQPTLSSKGANLDKRVSLSDSACSPIYKVYPNFMQFGNFKILRWSPTLDSVRYTKQIRVDALLLSGNPKAKLSDILATVNCSMLLIDGSNVDHRIKKWQAEAHLLQIPFRVLKYEKAFVVKL